MHPYNKWNEIQPDIFGIIYNFGLAFFIYITVNEAHDRVRNTYISSRINEYEESINIYDNYDCLYENHLGYVNVTGELVKIIITLSLFV